LQPPTEGEVSQAVLRRSNGFAVIELESVVDGELDQDSLLAQQQYERILANGRASQEAFALMRRLRSAAEIQVFEDRIN
jgi:hypothetical protein